jgi:hypothetical protein
MVRRSIAAAAVLMLAAAGCGSGGGGEAPDPGGNEDANVAAPPPGGRLFGFNTALSLWAVRAPVEVKLEKLAGANAQRYGVAWRTVQPQPGTPPFQGAGAGEIGRLDALYGELVRQRMRPVIVVSDAPRWAAGSSGGDGFGLAPDRSHLDDWGRYVRAVATRYPRAVIEPWNEPNFKSFWHSGDPDPAAMARLQCGAYRAVKRLSRRRVVLSPGFAVTTTMNEDGSPAYAEYAGKFYERGGGRCFDAVSAHVYGGNRPELGAGSLFAAEMADLRSVRDRHRDRTPIWVTEAGGSSIPEQLTEAQQARMNVRLYNRLLTMKDVHAVIFNTLRDARDPQLVGRRGIPNYHYGFLREGFRPKPVYCAFIEKARHRLRGCR